jgi:hypothetical protein
MAQKTRESLTKPMCRAVIELSKEVDLFLLVVEKWETFKASLRIAADPDLQAGTRLSFCGALTNTEESTIISTGHKCSTKRPRAAAHSNRERLTLDEA